MSYYNLIVKNDQGINRTNDEFRTTSMANVKKRLLEMFQNRLSNLFGWYTQRIKLEVYNEPNKIVVVYNVSQIITLTIEDICTCKHDGDRIAYYTNSGKRIKMVYDQFFDGNFMMLSKIVNNQLQDISYYKSTHNASYTKMIISDIKKTDNFVCGSTQNTPNVVITNDQYEKPDSAKLSKLYKNLNRYKFLLNPDQRQIFIFIDWDKLCVPDLTGILCNDPDFLGSFCSNSLTSSDTDTNSDDGPNF